MKLSLYLRDTFVTCPDKEYPALQQIYMENIANWSNNQENGNRIAYNIITKSLSEGYFCLQSRQMYQGQ